MSGGPWVDGAVDLHCHFGPEPVVERVTGERAALSAEEAVRDAAAAGQRGLVLKPHEFPTTATAAVLRAAVPDVQTFGAVTCDAPIGGLNPTAVRVALDAGARMVWLPTLSAASAQADKRERAFGSAPAVAVLDEDGELTDDVREVMSLVQEYDVLLATGHIGRDEHFAVARAMQGRGRVIATHVLQQGAGPNLSADDCVELAGLGAFLEFTAHTCAGQPDTIATVMGVIQRAGVERCVVSTDYGWNERLPRPTAGFEGYLAELDHAGVPAAQLELMAATTPARLVGLE